MTPGRAHRPYVMGEISDDAVIHLEVDGHCRAAQFGMGPCCRVRMIEPADARDVSGKTQNFRIVDIVDHIFPIRRRQANSDCRYGVFHSLGTTIYNAGSRVSTRQRRAAVLAHFVTPLAGWKQGEFSAPERSWSVQLVPPERGTNGRRLYRCRHQENHVPSDYLDKPVTDRPSEAEVEAAVRTLLRWTGDNPNREG